MVYTPFMKYHAKKSDDLNYLKHASYLFPTLGDEVTILISMRFSYAYIGSHLGRFLGHIWKLYSFVH